MTSCVPGSSPASQYQSIPGYESAHSRQINKRTHDKCETVTITQWVTTTATQTVTGVESVIVTKTIKVPTVVPTTIDKIETVALPTTVLTTVDKTNIVTDYRTVLATVWVPTTYTNTKTVSMQYPVTQTVDSTIFKTSYVTSHNTVVTTIATSYPVVSLVTQPVTETRTVTALGQPTILTLPGTTETRPGSTFVRTLTRTISRETKTVTENETPRTVTQPGQTITQTTTRTRQPTTVSLPDKTVTVTPIFDVTLCPKPTGASAPLDPHSDLTFGCKPGYVCNPPKPDGCNLWPDPPSPDYLCPKDSCIPAPPYANATWKECETSYYPPAYGYFDLNPEAFGLSYDIFEYSVQEETRNGQLTTITTGNWASQTSLSQWPRMHARNAPKEESGCSKSKREVTPSICFDNCEAAWRVAQSKGKTNELCKSGSDFRLAHDKCTTCISGTSSPSSNTADSYVKPRFAEFINFCSGRAADKPSVSSGVEPEPAVSEIPSVKTTSQADVRSQTFKPVQPTQTASKGEGDKPMVTSRIEPDDPTAGAPATHAESTVNSDAVSNTVTNPETISAPSVDSTGTQDSQSTQGASTSDKEPSGTSGEPTGASSTSTGGTSETSLASTSDRRESSSGNGQTATKSNAQSTTEGDGGLSSGKATATTGQGQNGSATSASASGTAVTGSAASVAMGIAPQLVALVSFLVMI